MTDTLRHIDHWLFRFINQDLANPALDVVCLTLRSGGFLALWYFVLAIVVYRLYPHQFLKIAIAGSITFLLTDQFSAHVIKFIFHRLRPCNNSEIHARLIANHCGAGFSFVSAHAANSFGIATLLSIIRPQRAFALILGTWASLVAFSQVYVGVHFPADVVGGALLGITTGAITGTILKKYLALAINNQ